MSITFLKTRAFTLVELMITIAILSILLTIAVPAFTALIQNNYSTTISNALISSLQFARSEAIKLNIPVSICATSDANFNACGSNWELGWIVFTDTDSNGALSGATDILRVQHLTGDDANMTFSNNTNSLTYTNVGFPLTGSTSNITVDVYADGCKGDYRRTIAISVTGRVTSTRTTCP